MLKITHKGRHVPLAAFYLTSKSVIKIRAFLQVDIV